VTKQEAVYLVASHVAGNLRAGTTEEATGIHWVDLDKMSDADRERLAVAMDEVARRLDKMGTEPREDVR
jgi:hypothetical protein